MESHGIEARGSRDLVADSAESAGVGGPFPAATFDRFLGPLEYRIMDDLWDAGESSVGDVLDRLNGRGKRLVYNTVMSTMARLADKGYLERERDGRAFLYRPAATRPAFLEHRAKEVIDGLLEDVGRAAIPGIADRLRADPALLAEFRRLDQR